MSGNRLSGALSPNPLARTTAATTAAPTPVLAVADLAAPVAAEAPQETATSVAPPAMVPASPASDDAPAKGFMKVSELGLESYKAGGRRPAADLDGSPPVRLTAYLTEQQVRALRDEVHRRQKRRQRADLSMLLREAVTEFLARRSGA